MDVNVLYSVRLLNHLLVDHFPEYRLLDHFLENLLLNNDLLAEEPAVKLEHVNLLLVKDVINLILICINVFGLINELLNVVVLDSLSGLSSWDSNLFHYLISPINWNIDIGVPILDSWDCYDLIDINPVNDFVNLLNIFILMNNLRHNSFDEFVNVN